MRVPWTARRSNQSILKEINPEYSLEGLMLKLKLQYFGHLMGRTDSLEKTVMLGKIEGRRRRGQTEDEMVGWHHRLNGYEFEQALGDDAGQGSLACCSPWGHKGSGHDSATELMLFQRSLHISLGGYFLVYSISAPGVMTASYSCDSYNLRVLPTGQTFIL